MKKCSCCKVFRELSEFVKSKRRQGGLTEDCKRCRYARTEAWRKRNPEKVRAYGKLWRSLSEKKEIILKNKRKYRERHPEKAREQVRAAVRKNKVRYAVKNFGYWLKERYGITVDQYHEIAGAQKGVCAICKRAQLCEDKTKFRGRLFVDHCHASGRVRGLLCFKCNVMLGCANDKIEVLLGAVKYLEDDLNNVE